MLTACPVRRAITLIDVACVADGPRGALTNAYSERVFRAAWHALERSKSAAWANSWTVYDGRLLRYRCHTGHAFSALSLDEAAAQGADDAIWGAIRAVHERIIFARERQQWAERVGSAAEVAVEQARIDENKKLA